MNYSEIKYCDIANGEGVRTSLFVSGCRRGCPHCFNKETWSFTYGKPFTQETEDAILESLKPPYIEGLTLLGGEPMELENQEGLVCFVERVRKAFPDKTIWCFTGMLYEDLLEGGPFHGPYTDRLLACIDVLIDGPFEIENYSIDLRFKGSSNQRIIDLAASRKASKVVLWEDDPALLHGPIL
ncbi:MAG: anaerobic ribonucleoside-triphosphate reductase activating protein [Eggerthellaceae bacterium]|jgi:anaerobic ribonucleoside-triphosphate reductase activating protein